MALVSSLYKLGPSLILCQRSSMRTEQFTRQLKSDLKIKWVRPEKIPSIQPEMSGDLKPLGTLDMRQLPFTYKASKELQSANDLVKRIYTLEFFNRQIHKEEFMNEYTNRVKAHKHDDDSPEVKIARMTVTIRNLQIHMEQYKKDKINKVRLKEAIDKRNKHIAKLRKVDYKKYEWLLEKLDVEHKPFWFNCAERVERKKSLRRLAMLFSEKVKAERLARHRQFLDSQKPDFLREKLERLEWIRDTEQRHALEPTVTDADVDATRRQLADSKAAIAAALDS